MKTFESPRRAVLAALAAAVIGAGGCAVPDSAVPDSAAPAPAAAGGAGQAVTGADRAAAATTGADPAAPATAATGADPAAPATAAAASTPSGKATGDAGRTASAARSAGAATLAPASGPPTAATSARTSRVDGTQPPKPVPALSKEQARGAGAEAARLLTAAAPGLAGTGWIPCGGHDAPYRSGAELIVRDPKGGATQRGLVAGYRDCYYFENPQNAAVLTLSVLEYQDVASASTAVSALDAKRRQKLTDVRSFAIGASRSFGGAARAFEVDPRFYLSTIRRQDRLVLVLDHSTSIVDSPDGGAGPPTVRVLAGLQQRVSRALTGFRPTPPGSLATLNPDPTKLAAHTIAAGPGGARYPGGKLGAFPAAAAPALTIDDATSPEEQKLIHKAEVDTIALGGARVYRTVHPAAAVSLREGLYRLAYEQKTIAGQRIAVKAPTKDTVCFAATSSSVDPTDVPATTYVCAGNVGRYAFLFTARALVAPKPDVNKMVIGPVRKQAELLAKLG
ncbi:hypothetical protein [Nakamurella aerolata]|uniref:Uncharacterized protein n=1 Tax=Nakamurella aerolata TaxID=1656892 RepID=A0A849A4Z8_9ACTN|nr:hypothetical protein [Nakamurella aerolata]NNG35137.1 hypothetical protein [Nakamurella aerolata]